jgi:hypothetical protein
MSESLSSKVTRRLRMTASSAALWGPDKLSYRAGLRTTEGYTLPDFLGLGAQRAGSTWLWGNLRCHPDLFLPSRKELHYFNLYFYAPLETYASRFLEGAGKIKGEITPAYSILPRAKIGFVRQIMPSVKLLLVLRNPIDRAWSRAKMGLRELGPQGMSSRRFSERRFRQALVHRSSRARGDYLTIIDNWLHFFPQDQLKICIYDDLAHDPQEFLRDIFTFLGVTTDVPWDRFPFTVVPNPTPTTPMPDEYRALLQTMYHSQIEELYQRFGSKVEAWRCA